MPASILTSFASSPHNSHQYSNPSPFRNATASLYSSLCFLFLLPLYALLSYNACLITAGGFKTHKELHYSQTTARNKCLKALFKTHKELHYSQTTVSTPFVGELFKTHKELHYSQTFAL